VSSGAAAIVVLGCRVLPSGEPSRTLARRARAAAKAYHEGWAPRIIAAGGRRWSGHAEAPVIAAELVRAGVPEHAIFLELCSFSTVENAIYASDLVRGLGASRALVATSPWHMARALAAFHAAGLTAHPVEGASDPPPESLGDRFDQAYRAVHEVVCTTLDARAMQRSTVLRASAAWLGGAKRAPHRPTDVARRSGA
jgi:uncharacterized SAM-binding protein YcdF (DUF218 family)